MNRLSRRSVLSGALSGWPAVRLARAAPDPIVADTAYGKVRGAGVNGVCIFRGIPYGGPTEGAGRFMPPSKPGKWSGVRDATVNGPQCVQQGGNVFSSPQLGEYFAAGARTGWNSPKSR